MIWKGREAGHRSTQSEATTEQDGEQDVSQRSNERGGEAKATGNVTQMDREALIMGQ
jgi:hypothetical protein